MVLVALIALVLPVRFKGDHLYWSVSYAGSSPIVWTKECIVVWRDVENGDIILGIGYDWRCKWFYNTHTRETY